MFERDETPIYNALAGRYGFYRECVHGLSLDLCDGPSHYPLDDMYDLF